LFITKFQLLSHGSSPELGIYSFDHYKNFFEKRKYYSAVILLLVDLKSTACWPIRIRI